MTQLNSSVTRRHAPSVQNRERQSDQTAEFRALTYALFSKLMRSPFENLEVLEQFFDSGELIDLFGGLQETLPYKVEFQVMSDKLQSMKREEVFALRRIYSSLFEVGSEGPPVPLRAELVRAGVSKMKEELIRFYNYFSYDLQEQIAWAPDHLSIQLEFMQVLCLKESAQGERGDISFERAQLDFLDRHIVCWLPISLGKLVALDRGGFYTIVMAALWNFLEQDRLWNIQTATQTREGE